MAAFQVVAVGQRTGQRFPVRDVHGSFKEAEFHRALCAVTFPDEVYEVDMTSGRGGVLENVDGAEDLGYPPHEIESVRERARELAARRRFA